MGQHRDSGLHQNLICVQVLSLYCIFPKYLGQIFHDGGGGGVFVCSGGGVGGGRTHHISVGSDVQIKEVFNFQGLKFVERGV